MRKIIFLALISASFIQAESILIKSGTILNGSGENPFKADILIDGARIIEIVSKENRKISEIENELPLLYSTPELNIDVTDETKFKIIEDFSKECSLDGEKITIDGLRINFKNGWGLLRASNTTPKLVLRFEGNSVDDLNQIKINFLNELSRICPNIDINLV